MLDDDDVGAAAAWAFVALLVLAAAGFLTLGYLALDWLVRQGHAARWW